MKHNSEVVNAVSRILKDQPSLLTHLLSRSTYNGNTDDCWLWKGALSDGKFPKAQVGGKVVNVGRLLACYFAGPSPRKRHRSCHKSHCINPWHLDLQERHPGVQAKQSIRLRVLPSWMCKSCAKGHPIIGTNIYPSTQIRNGTKYLYDRCKICSYRAISKSNGISLEKSINQIEEDLRQYQDNL